MEIFLPDEINFQKLDELRRRYQVASATVPVDLCIDWTGVKWVNLPEVVEVLCWSSKIVQLGGTVEWRFRDPRVSVGTQLEDLRFQAVMEIGQETHQRVLAELEELRRRAFDSKLYPRSREAILRKIEDTIKARRGLIPPITRSWLDKEVSPLRYMDVLAYLNRYEFFDRTSEMGISLSPDPRRLPMSDMDHVSDTPCLPLRQQLTNTAVSELVAELATDEELARVLGSYSSLSVVRSGAFAHVLLTELGRNIAEHSGAAGAWVCTRLVRADRIASIATATDPAMAGLRGRNAGFLEVIVADNGEGLIAKLTDVLRSDRRELVRERYGVKLQNVVLPDEVLIDYAFDRLSSTKRDIAQLVHLAKQRGPEAAVVSSGLYWVWTLIRTHRGLVAVRTANSYAWYDFGDKHPGSDWGLQGGPFPESIRLGGPFPGTMVRILLPLVDRRGQAGQTIPSRVTSIERVFDHPIVDQKRKDIRIVWVGDLARRVPWGGSLPSTKYDAESTGYGQEQLDETREVKLLAELEKEHFPLQDGQILVLDLCGTRHAWAMRQVSALCQFVLEMNHTSPTGRCGVVLWNVPSSEADLFREALHVSANVHPHLHDLRRASLVILDDGSTEVCPPLPILDKPIKMLNREGRLELDLLCDGIHDEEKREQLLATINENAHLFHWVSPTEVSLRAWQREIAAEACRNGLEWLEYLTDRTVDEGGAKRHLDNSYYRLPSSGYLVRDFYQFGGLLSNQETSRRIAWLIAQVVRGIEEKTQKKVDWLISVTRSTMNLVMLTQECLVPTRDSLNKPRVLAKNTVPELSTLARELKAKGTAVLITDVISSGALTHTIADSLLDHQINWLGTVAILDTTGPAEAEVQETREEATPETLGFDLTVHRVSELATGTGYALCRRVVVKLAPGTAVDEPVIQIHPVNVCPVDRDDLPVKPGQVWQFVKNKPQALRVGHLRADGYHHYIYYVSILDLLDAPKIDTHFTLREKLVARVKADLERNQYNPDKTVIIHPPRESSYAQEIAISIQHETGILYRHVIYRDVVSGQWRFHPLVQHGLNFQGFTVVVVDDGTNTGETLLAMLDAAVRGRPARILSYLGISRLPTYKIDLFSRLICLKHDSECPVEVYFALGLGIPTYSPQTCPICQCQAVLDEVGRLSRTLRRYAAEMSDSLDSTTTGLTDEPDRAPYLWQYSSDINVAELRESIALSRNYEIASKLLHTKLALIIQNNQVGVSDIDTLLDIGFLVCSEPFIVRNEELRPHLRSLVRRATEYIKDSPENQLLTLIGMVCHLLYELSSTDQDMVPDQEISGLWIGILKRSHECPRMLGSAVVLAVAVALMRSKENIPAAKQFGPTLIRALSTTCNATAFEGHDVVRSVGRLMAREGILCFKKEVSSLVDTLSSPASVYNLAVRVAGRFYSHGARDTRGAIEQALKQTELNSKNVWDQIGGLLEDLLCRFDELHELCQVLISMEDKHASSGGRSPGLKRYWNAPELRRALAAFGDVLLDLWDCHDQKVFTTEQSSPLLEMLPCWDRLSYLLTPAFETLFPEVVSVAHRMWDKFEQEAKLPKDIAINGARKWGRAIVVKGLNEKERVFLPLALVERFLSGALVNLRNYAFSDWTNEKLVREAAACVEIEAESDVAGKHRVILWVIDNGNGPPPDMQKGDLTEVNTMAQDFDAAVNGPIRNGNETRVGLKMCIKRKG